MTKLDHILSNAAINAIILAIYCTTQFFTALSNHRHFLAAGCVFAAFLCARDAVLALTYKH